MEPGCSTRYASYIDKLLIQELSPKKMSRLRGHIATCESCQQRYNRVVMASRLLEGGPAALDLPAQRELDWIEPEVLERARLVPDSEPARRSLLLRIAAPAVTIAALLAVGVPLLIRGTAPEDPTRPRGDEPVMTTPGVAPVHETAAKESATAQPATAQPATAQPAATDPSFQARGTTKQMSTKVGLRAFCIHRTEESTHPSITGLVPASATAPPASCRVQDILRFAYTNRSKLGFLFLMGLDEQYEIKWYEPHPPRLSSIPVDQNIVDKPLTRAVRLQVNHREGQVRLFAVFSERPLTAAQVKRAVARARAGKTPLEKLQVLPLDNTEQRSLLVKLAP